MSTLARPRSIRRAASRVEARKHPIAPKPSSFGETAELVHSRPRLPQPRLGTTSGQRRVNAKRTQRGEFWRTVRVQVWPEMETYFREHLHHLGDGTRIVSQTLPAAERVIDFHVHIPGAPSNAASAEPAWYVDHRHAEPRPYLDHIDWYDAGGQLIETAELAGSAA
jgi:hypothetical protein